MIKVVRPSEIRMHVRTWRAQGQRIALVPTMGNLHAGHAALVKLARGQANRVVVSIFVNPLQFGPNEDFNRYPRTPEDDRKVLEASDADTLFAPEVADVYPHGQINHSIIDVPGISDILCGEVRPGHFQGVATVVAKLFNIVQPDVAYFGEKDFQQLAVIKRMALDLCFPLTVIGAPTVRDADGLALSSRNRYLGPEQRRQAPAIYAALQAAVHAIESGSKDFIAIENAGARTLSEAGMKPDYFSIRDADNLLPPTAETRELVVLAAARLGNARLIDNLRVSSRQT